ncbi:MAG TPA: hypothetical protein VIG68_05200, partial [Lysobacter sp.]
MRDSLLAPVLSLALTALLGACDPTVDGAVHDSNAADGAAGAAVEFPTETLASEHGALQVATITAELEHPWAVAPLPDGGFLVTE